ncbi:hypothetical protein CONPUDRAFT_151487, partial [Coniophora puteana RWD-64-598 SS2]
IKRSQLQDTVNEALQQLEAGADPSTLRLDSKVATQRDRSVAWVLNGWKAINKPEVVRGAFSRCTVRGGFSLSFDSLTSPSALRILREIPRSDPTLWDRISPSIPDAPDVPTVTPADHQDPIELDTPFSGEDFDDDTWQQPNDLMARILNPVDANETTISGPGMVDNVNVDLATVQVPSSDEAGRRKRRRVSNKKYGDFVGH